MTEKMKFAVEHWSLNGCWIDMTLLMTQVVSLLTLLKVDCNGLMKGHGIGLQLQKSLNWGSLN